MAANVSVVPAYSNRIVVVFPFCSKDGELAIKMADWMKGLGEVDSLAVLHYDDKTPTNVVEAMRARVGGTFKEGSIDSQYYAPQTNTWPQAPNHCFQAAVQFVREKLNRPFLFFEPDAFPIRQRWFEDIQREYDIAYARSKMFMGHWVPDVIPRGHMTGVGVYPPNVGRFSRGAMLALNRPWDVEMTKDIRGWFHDATHLFQHYWGNNLEAYNGAMFKCWNDVAEGTIRVDFRKAIYHRCKDGSAIDVMIEHAKSTAVNVPVHTSAAKVVELPVFKVAGTCRIFIVSHLKDFPWLEYCLKAIDKYARGFSGVTVAVPSGDIQKAPFVEMRNTEVAFVPFDEVHGKGMLHHMICIARADQFCPLDDFILHMDSDTIIKEPVTPADYIVGGKPVYVVRTYDSLIGENGVVSDCHQWKTVAEKNLGFPVTMYTMCRHPSCFPKCLYPAFRGRVSEHHNMDFDAYVLSCRNEFPQTFAEFPAIGAYAWEMLHELFYWIDVQKDGAPKDKMLTFWSHGGLGQKTPDGRTAEQVIKDILAADNWPAESVKPLSGKHKRGRKRTRTKKRDWKTWSTGTRSNKSIVTA